MSIFEMRPSVRTNDLLCRRLESGEVVVFDRRDNRAHCLNPAAASIWAACDGTRTVAEIAASLSDLPGAVRDTSEVLKALHDLQGLNLVEGLSPDSIPASLLTRREAFSRVGSRVATAAAMIPIIATVLAPKSASASSCLQHGQACSVGVQCCSGVCAGGFCV